MPNYTYDIKMCHKSILPILVSKEASEPQHSHPLIIFLINLYFNIEKFKKHPEIFPLQIWRTLCILRLEKEGLGATLLDQVGF